MANLRGLVLKILGGLLFPCVIWTYENVALHKSAWQQHPYGNDELNALLAVDGRMKNLSLRGGECVISGAGETAEWRVDLQNVLSIHHIVIQYVQSKPVWGEDDVSTAYQLGFSIYVSNTTNKEEGVLCFRDTKYTRATVPNPVNITCSYHGRYVIYYNNRTGRPLPDGYSTYAFNDLCEVEVHGCPSPGFYGENCSIPCPHHCQEGHCHIVEGTCLGCLPGYRGVTCNDECEEFKYGLECNQACGNCSRGEQCYHVNGSCLNGCDAGVQGDKCDSECRTGRFGENCRHYCSRHCAIPGKCDRVTGHCIGGCQAGWKNTQCDQKCDGRMFGKDCKESCGKCLNHDHCHRINGSCGNGCNPGYYGINCIKECPVGLYGTNCENLCSPNCREQGVCDRMTGQCEEGCQAGWTQPNCSSMCDNGMFGQDCNERCGECLGKEQCHHVNGSCINGCKPGYKGFMCTKERITTTHGQTNRQILSAVTAAILITALVTIVVVVLIIGRRRSQVKVQRFITTHIEGRGNRTENNDPMTNNSQEYVFSTLSTNDIQSSYVQEITPNLECENASLQRYTGRPENSEVYLAKELISSDKHIDKSSITAAYDICSEDMPDLLVNQLYQTIVEMKKCEDEGFKREYSMLSNGELFPCNVGKQKENSSKNRYKTAFPYDHSRVIIFGDNESSEYINANFIEDSKRELAYIATQGPKENTVNDFWRMIWQQNVTKIVMLTNLAEGGKIKCFKYWPDCSNPELYGNVTIENVLERHFAFYITRQFVLSHNQKQLSRDIIQYHYTMWPDHGTPEPLSLALFHNQVLRASCDENRTPMAVHCSAGIGRTGTFIALDALYREGKRTGKINVAKYVTIMRSCRMNMVQTYGQYMTIFVTLNERFKASLQTQCLSTFKDNLDSVLDSPLKQTFIGREFETLLHIRPEYTVNDYLEANHHMNKSDAVLPLDRYMLFLTSPVDNRGSYINAIYVSSYLQNDAFIVTHYPPPEDAVDFLRLLIDHESNTVICMDPLSKIESSKSWLPGSSSDKMVDPLCVQCVGETETDVKVTEIRILNKEELNHEMIYKCTLEISVSSKAQYIHCFPFKDLSHTVSLVEPREVLGPDGTLHSLRCLVSIAMNVSTEGPITIICKDGASLCGAFCAVFNCIQQINMDDSVDVLTTVRKLQTRRPEFCSTLDEYLLVYRALCDYIGTVSENIYENM